MIALGRTDIHLKDPRIRFQVLEAEVWSHFNSVLYRPVGGLKVGKYKADQSDGAVSMK